MEAMGSQLIKFWYLGLVPVSEGYGREPYDPFEVEGASQNYSELDVGRTGRKAYG